MDSNPATISDKNTIYTNTNTIQEHTETTQKSDISFISYLFNNLLGG